MKAETDAIWQRIPIDLRDRYRASWNAYGRRPSAETYRTARAHEDELQDAIKKASRELKRRNAKAIR